MSGKVEKRIKENSAERKKIAKASRLFLRRKREEENCYLSRRCVVNQARMFGN